MCIFQGMLGEKIQNGALLMRSMRNLLQKKIAIVVIRKYASQQFYEITCLDSI
jgi:hypothetical protein